jgi:hypothetical protein
MLVRSSSPARWAPRWCVAAVALLMAIAVPAAAQPDGPTQVPQMSTADLAVLLANPRAVLVLDVREREEYAVSHVRGA